VRLRLKGGRQAGRWRIALLLVLVVAGVLIVALQSYRVVDRELTQSALARRGAVSFLAATVLTEKFDRLLDIGVALATRVRFRQLVERGRWEEAIAILATVSRDFPFIDHISLDDLGGTQRADLPPDPQAHGQSFAHRDWHQSVVRTGRPYVSRLYRRGSAPQRNVFVAAIPIKSDAGAMIAMLVLQVRSDLFFEWTRGVDVDPGGFVFVVDQRGFLAYRPDRPLQAELSDYSRAPPVQRVLQGKRGVEILPDPETHDERVVAYQPIGAHGWGVVLSEPAASVFALRNDQLNWMVFTYLLSLVSLGALAYFASRIAVHRRQIEQAGETHAELERRVRERTVELERANRELEGFSYSVSHDLRAPVRAIEGFARILEEEAADKLDPQARKYLGMVRDNGRRMGVLIESLLEFSRLGRRALNLGDTDMGELARDVFEELSGGMPSNPEFTLAAMPRARCDRALIRQVWTNLISNAIKFTGKTPAPRIEVGGSVGNGESTYYVRDNGAGFDMRYYEKMFGVFQRLHGEHEFAGTGVGLALVQRIVERHGGRVWAEGKVGEGATFWFSLPARRGG
jgi:signal transduction histidine kinase